MYRSLHNSVRNFPKELITTKSRALPGPKLLKDTKEFCSASCTKGKHTECFKLNCTCSCGHGVGK